MKYSILLAFSLLLSTISAQKPINAAEICALRKANFLNAPPSSADTRSDSIDLTHTSIVLDLSNFATGQIAGNCTQNFKAKVNGVPEIRLDLQSLLVDSVFLNGVSTAYTFQNKTIKVTFPTPLNTGQTGKIRVRYHGDPINTTWGGFYTTSAYAYNLGIGIGTEPPNFGRVWYPCFDNFRERSTYDFTIVSPSGKPAYCNGILTEATTLPDGKLQRKWVINQEIPSYLACVALGSYTSFKRTYQGENGAIPVEIAALAADTNNLRNSFQHLPQALSAFEYWFGPYRWDKIGYSLVPFNGGAMEHATNIAYPKSSVDGTTASETLFAHEFAHHWWGDLATCSEAGDMWLNEGWASYSEHLFLEKVYGHTKYLQTVEENHLNVLQNAHISEGAYRAVSGIPAAYTYGTHIYNKGAVMAANLRGYLGDSLFQIGCRSAMQTTQFDDWSSADFRDKLTASTGIDMTDFFEDWVFSGGYASYSVDSFRIIPSPISSYLPVKVNVKQKLRGAPHLHHNVPLDFTFIGQNQRITFTRYVSDENTELIINVPFPPDFVFLNTKGQLNLAIASKEKMLKTVGTSNFSPAKMELKINSIGDSVLMRIEHHFAMPDTAGIANPANHKLTSRFWRVAFLPTPGFDVSNTMFYDGRGQQDQLDTELFAQNSSEADVLLLYRSGAGQPWEEYDDYIKTTLAATDRYGFVRAMHLKPGDYTFAKGVSTNTTTAVDKPSFNAKISPNPAQNMTNITSEEEFSQVIIYNALGEVVQDTTFAKTKQWELVLNKLDAGSYWVVLMGEKGSVTLGLSKL
jgi:Peptidase family M1 domain/Peptidase M1 N-terminal domain/Secretion system C-terminal sorting domain